jgi:hypothetical protein
MVNLTMVKKPVTMKMLNNVQNQLFQLTIIDKKGTFDEIVKTALVFLIVGRTMINIKNISLKFSTKTSG